MIKRIAQYFGPFDERQPPKDYWVITSTAEQRAGYRALSQALQEEAGPEARVSDASG